MISHLKSKVSSIIKKKNDRIASFFDEYSKAEIKECVNKKLTYKYNILEKIDKNKNTSFSFLYKKKIEDSTDIETNQYIIIVKSKSEVNGIIRRLRGMGVRLTVNTGFKKNRRHYYIYDADVPEEISKLLEGGDGGASNV